MKRLALLLSLVILSPLGFGQVIDKLNDLPDQLPKEKIVLDEEHPILIQVVTNSWYKYYPDLYSFRDIIAAVAEKVHKARPDMVLAETTANILQEARERHLLDAEEYVDHSGSSFQKGSIKPHEWVLEVYLSGSGTSQTTGAGVRLGNNRIALDTEGGTSTAIARYRLVRRSSFVGVATITVKESYSSTNVTGADLGQIFGSRTQLAYDQHSNGGYRRGLITTTRALNSSDDAIARLLGSS